MVQDTPENVGLVRIEDEMRDSYLDYAMSVIVSRALPDVRDGLKPVQRRILFGMQELGVGPNSSFKKTARIVGEVMGKFHPHGDSAIYDALVRMAQDFTMRYPLVTGQGNFGSIDGDPPAQMRYTEARLAPIASEMIADLDRNTVDFQPNFDDTINEPIVMPSRLPNLLLNGASGIAVGMATNIPPHNLIEICDAVVAVIDNPEISIDALLEIVKGPDFPTAAMIFNQAEIRQAYATGRGRITMRARMELEESKAGRHQIVVTELPYQTNKATLLERIADMVRSKRIEGISDLRDESDRHGMRVVIELGRTATYQSVRNQLYKHSALQSTFAFNMLALDGGQPKTLNLRDALQAFVNHRREVIRRRSEFDLEKARERAHILEGLLKALENLDAIIKAIRESESADAAKTALQGQPFDLSERQAQAVLDMQLRRLAALERQKIEDEHKQLMELITYLEDLLANPYKIDGLIKDDCAELKEKYGDARRTQIVRQAVEDISEEDLVPHQQVVVTISERGYMKRVPLDTYRVQRRGGRGVTGMTTREEDAVRHLLVCDTHDGLLLFTRGGKVYQLKGFEVPEGSRTARGIPVANLVEMQSDDRVTAVVVVKDFSRDSMLLVTDAGEVKRTPLNHFESVRRNGLIAMNLAEGDWLVSARAARAEDDVIIVASDGQAMRFNVGILRVASRTSGGVRGIRLKGDARVIATVIDSDGDDMLVVSEKGLGKRTPITEYPSKGRGGGGVITFRVSSRSGALAVARAVRPEQELILVSAEGIVMRCRADTISQQGRSTQGVQVMNVGATDKVAALAVIDLSNAPGASPFRRTAGTRTTTAMRRRRRRPATAPRRPRSGPRRPGRRRRRRSSPDAASRRARPPRGDAHDPRACDNRHMPLDDLGEFGLIDRIVARLGDAAARDILVPPGDDAAAWAVERGAAVATIDALAEGTHWRADTMTYFDVGWRTVACNVSDLAAMGARPGHLLVAAMLGPALTLDDLDAFIDGMAAACRRHGVHVAGGNIVRAASTAFTIAAYGSAAVDADGQARVLRRNGARPGDAVAVSGTLGASGAGLALIRAGRADEAAAAPLVEVHRRPLARPELGLRAVAAGVRCGIDVSDGLAQDAGHLAERSQVGIEIAAAQVPVAPGAAALLGDTAALDQALGGGEDYELILTGPRDVLRALETPALPVTLIGRVVADHPGEVVIWTDDGQPYHPPTAGWDQVRSAAAP